MERGQDAKALLSTSDAHFEVDLLCSQIAPSQMWGPGTCHRARHRRTAVLVVAAVINKAIEASSLGNSAGLACVCLLQSPALSRAPPLSASVILLFVMPRCR